MEDTKTQLRRLDSSFKYTPVMQYLEVGFAEYGYLSSNKTQYSFLTYTYEYNSNYDFDAVKVYTKISKSKLKNISNDIIRAHDFNNSNCHRLIFNINFNWNISRLKKLFTKSVKLRQRSLRTYFKEGDEGFDKNKAILLPIWEEAMETIDDGLYNFNEELFYFQINNPLNVQNCRL